MYKPLALFAALAMCGPLAPAPVSAAPFIPSAANLDAGDPGLIHEAQFRGRRGAVFVRPAVRPARPFVRPGLVYVNRPWRGRYWRPGIGWAVGSVVAVGFLTAAAAAAYAPPPPGPGMCWYYTDRTYRAGYWAQCTEY